MRPARQRPPWRSAAAALQLGQTLLLLGAAVLTVGLVFHHSAPTIAIGAVLLVVGLVVLVLGLRARRGPRD